MEKVTIKLQCPKCGKKLSAAITKGTNVAAAKVRCNAGGCGYIGKGAEFMFAKIQSANENVCPKCGTSWQTRYGSKEILVCPECGNSGNIIQKIKLS